MNSMKGKKGLEAVRASLDSIFSTEGLMNIQRLREGTLSSLPEESFSCIPDTSDPITHFTPRPSTIPPTGTIEGTVIANIGTMTAPTTGTTTPPVTVPTTAPTTSPLTERNGLSPGQAKLLDFLMTTGPSCRMTYKEIADLLGLKQFSVRDNIYLFRNNGWLTTMRWRVGTKNGTQINMRMDRVPSDYLIPTTRPLTIPTEVPVRLPVVGTTISPLKIDREDLNLSISLEVIRTTWPNLAQSGFGVEQVNQIVANLTATGKPTSRIVQGLDHIEFELANGQMVDKDSQRVSDPCSWAFKALAQNGYYRRPKGYVSPEEQAAKDAEEEARSVIAARQKAEQVQFEAWRDGLTPDELTKALKGHPGGPKDAWLKSVWKKNLTKT